VILRVARGIWGWLLGSSKDAQMSREMLEARRQAANEIAKTPNITQGPF
jgi:hypothetical protein